MLKWSLVRAVLDSKLVSAATPTPGPRWLVGRGKHARTHLRKAEECTLT